MAVFSCTIPPTSFDSANQYMRWAISLIVFEQLACFGVVCYKIRLRKRPSDAVARSFSDVLPALPAILTGMVSLIAFLFGVASTVSRVSVIYSLLDTAFSLFCGFLALIKAAAFAVLEETRAGQCWIRVLFGSMSVLFLVIAALCLAGAVSLVDFPANTGPIGPIGFDTGLNHTLTRCPHNCDQASAGYSSSLSTCGLQSCLGCNYEYTFGRASFHLRACYSKCADFDSPSSDNRVMKLANRTVVVFGCNLL